MAHLKFNFWTIDPKFIFKRFFVSNSLIPPSDFWNKRKDYAAKKIEKKFRLVDASYIFKWDG